jgi:hypothetical protein
VADTKISALTAVTTPAITDQFGVNQGGTSKKLTLGQILSMRVYDAVGTYGAVFDGSTNTAAAIQAAIDAAGAAGGGIVQLPAGTGNLGTTSLVFKHSEVLIRGLGKGVTTLLYTGSTGAIKNNDEATPTIYTGCGVEDLTINHNGSASGASGLRIMALRQFKAKRVQIISNSTGAGTWYGIHLIGSATAETYFGQFDDIDIALTGATGTQWCVYMGGTQWVNRHTFTGGIWEGNNANAIAIKPTANTSDTNIFLGVSLQTHGSTIISLGGAGGDANDNKFIGVRMEVVGSSTVTFSTASGLAVRNVFIGCYGSNVNFSDPLESGGNTLMHAGDWKLDLYNGSDPSASIWLRGYQSGLTIGRADGASGVLTLGETNYATAPAANWVQLLAEDVGGLTQMRVRQSDASEWDVAMQKVFKLGTTHTISSATATEMTGLGPCTLVAGTYMFQAFLIAASSAVGTAVKIGLNFTGTAAVRAFELRYPSTGTTANTGIVDDVGATTGQIHESNPQTAFSTTAANMGGAGVATANANSLMVVEGVLVVTASGDLELWHGSSGAVATSVIAGSSLLVTRTA